jgi:hypothetical protein
MPRQTPQHAQAGPCNADVLDQTLPRLNCKKNAPYPSDQNGSPSIAIHHPAHRQGWHPSHRSEGSGMPFSYSPPRIPHPPQKLQGKATGPRPPLRIRLGESSKQSNRSQFVRPRHSDRSPSALDVAHPPERLSSAGQFAIPSYRMAFPNTQHGNTLQPTSTSANSHHAARFALRRNLRGSKYTSHLVSTPHAI